MVAGRREVNKQVEVFKLLLLLLLENFPFLLFLHNYIFGFGFSVVSFKMLKISSALGFVSPPSLSYPGSTKLAAHYIALPLLLQASKW